MRPFKTLISVDIAKNIVMNAVKSKSEIERILLEYSLGGVISSDIVAKMDVPPFDRAAMDGYAVKANDTFGAGKFKPITLKQTGVIFAGEKSKIKIRTGECVRIATGAIIPDGADAVVIIEDTECEKNNVKIFEPTHPGANISKKGIDVSKDMIILKKNTIMGSAKIGVLASLGYKTIDVYQKPSVAIIPTGNEIADVGTKLKDSFVYDSNSYSISAIIQESGGIPNKYRIVVDTHQEIENAITKALKNDLIVVTGGSSVGEKDILVDIVNKLGKVLFHGVQIKPGKPILCGLIDKRVLSKNKTSAKLIKTIDADKIIFGLPGYPTSCLVTGMVFVAPAVRKMAHLSQKNEKTIRAKLSKRLATSLGRRQYIPVKIEKDKNDNSKNIVVPVFKESGAITSMSNADGYIEIPENVDMIENGDEVDVVLF
jgi:molybdenum cofactor synthesis domain-containing protein